MSSELLTASEPQSSTETPAPRRGGGGPKTPEGRARNSMNAPKHGKYEQLATVLLCEAPFVCKEQRAAYVERFRLAGRVEHQIVSDLASMDSRPNRLLACESRLIDTPFRLEHTPARIQRFLLSQTVAGYRRLVGTSSLPECLTRYDRTQIPNIHNNIHPETEPPPNPDNPRPNPTLGTTEPENSAPQDLAP